MRQPLTGRLAAARAVTLGGCAALILIYSINSLLLAASGPNLTVWLIQTLPLAAMLPGLAKGRPRTYQWLSFLLLPYLIAAVLVAFSPGGLTVGLLEILFCLLSFTSAIVFAHGCRKRPAERMHENITGGGTDE